MGKGEGRGGNVTAAICRAGKKSPDASDPANPLAERDAVASDRPKFDGPEPVLPCRWYSGVHHALVAAACVALFVHDGFFLHSLPLTAFMVWYADAYTAVLHCALDREPCLDIPALHSAARGFQAHHEYPLASTRGRGLYRMLCDTHRIQPVAIASALAFARWNLTSVRVCLLKLALAAYGGAAGHFYAHGGGAARGSAVHFLQRAHLMLPPKHHVGGHHVKPHDKNFGIVNGLSNAALNPVLKSPSLGAILSAWAFLSLFDVAVIERCVEPAGATASAVGGAVAKTARGWIGRG